MTPPWVCEASEKLPETCKYVRRETVGGAEILQIRERAADDVEDGLDKVGGMNSFRGALVTETPDTARARPYEPPTEVE